MPRITPVDYKTLLKISYGGTGILPVVSNWQDACSTIGRYVRAKHPSLT